MTTLDPDRGARFLRIRQDLRMSQLEFGQMVGMKPSSISIYEKGRMPDESVLKKLHQMGYSIDWLLTGEGTMKRADRRHPDIVYPDQAVARDYMVLRDAPPSEEKSRRLLILMKELVCEFLNDPPPEGVEKKDPEKGG